MVFGTNDERKKEHKDESSFMSKLKKPFRELEEKLEGTHLHDAKVAIVHKKHQIGKFANLVSAGPRLVSLGVARPSPARARRVVPCRAVPY
jgi:hypothetical protein